MTGSRVVGRGFVWVCHGSDIFKRVVCFLALLIFFSSFFLSIIIILDLMKLIMLYATKNVTFFESIAF